VVWLRTAAPHGGAPSGPRCVSSPPAASQAKLRRAPHRRSQDGLEVKNNRTNLSTYPNSNGAATPLTGGKKDAKRGAQGTNGQDKSRAPN
jgi:hypothetical protein